MAIDDCPEQNSLSFYQVGCSNGISANGSCWGVTLQNQSYQNQQTWKDRCRFGVLLGIRSCTISSCSQISEYSDRIRPPSRRKRATLTIKQGHCHEPQGHLMKVSDGCRLTDIPSVLKSVSVNTSYVSSDSPLGLEGGTLRACDRHQTGFSLTSFAWRLMWHTCLI